MDDSRFIGIPYKRLCDTFEHTDCLGLVRLFYKEHGWKEKFYDDKPILHEQTPGSQIKRVIKYLRTNFDETNNPNELSYGDVMIFMINGDGHLGVMLDYGDILSTQIPSIEDKSYTTVYHRAWWTPFFRHGFKRKKV